MAKNKTTETVADVADYLAAIADQKKKEDCTQLVQLFEQHSGYAPKMWGTAIVGFGRYAYQYDSGHSGEAPIVGLAARANALTLYLGSEFNNRAALLEQFGKYKAGKGCIYVKKIEDINTAILGEMVKESVAYRLTNNHSK